MEEHLDFRWMDEVRRKLIVMFEVDEVNLVRILHYLDEEDKRFYSNPVRPHTPHWNSLRQTMHNDNVFRLYATQLISDATRVENEEKFRNKLRQMYEELPEYHAPPYEMQPYQGQQVMTYSDLSVQAFDLFSGLERAWSFMPVKVKEAVYDMIKQVGTGDVGRTVQTVMLRSSGTVVAVSLAAVQLGYRVYNHIKRWWNGEIDGSWCAKHVVDDTAALVAGGAGAAAGAACGSLIGPWGTVLGGIIGAFLAGIAANALIENLTQYLFGLPKSEAVSNAYRHLGVPMTASNSDVNRAYRQLCLRHHPDKGGDTNEFFVLQCHMAVIRQARGEY